MRLEIGGVQITSATVDELAELQEDNGTADLFLRTLDTLIKRIPLAEDLFDSDADTLNALRALALMSQTIQRLASPPDADDPDNDVPTLSI